MRLLQLLCLLAVLFAVAHPGPAAAQVETATSATVLAQLSQNRTLVPGGGGAEESAGVGWWGGVKAYIIRKQQVFYRELAAAVRNVETGSLAAAWTLVTLSLLYGVFHAAGPGHGKTVISAYLLADERLVKRGVALAFAASFLQAVSAIVLVSGAILVVSTVGKSANALTAHLETASYALISLIGVYMLWSALRAYVRHHRADRHDHGHGHDHAHGEACGHAHLPVPDQLSGEWSLRRAASIALAVGIRPCSGAVLVLVFANTRNLYAAGIGSTFAMALGTAVTVSTIAVTTVYSKRIASSLLGAESAWTGHLFRALAVAGSLAIIALGATLLWVTLTTERPFL